MAAAPDAAGVAPLEGALPPSALDGALVLLAEDEAVIAYELSVTLRGFGCDVLGPAATAADALDLLRGARPDVALLDVGLRDGPTTPVAEALAASGVPFILVTAYEPGDLEPAVLRGAPCLDKPYHAPELRRALLGALGRRPA